MNFFRLVLVLCGFIFYSGFSFAEKIRIPVGVYSEHLQAFQAAVADGDCPDLRNYPLSGNQVLAEFLVFCTALKIGGLEPEFEFKVFPVYARLLRTLNDDGTLASLGFAAWQRDLDVRHVYISTAIVPANQFVKGLYVRPEFASAFSLANRSQLQTLTAVTNANWSLDVEAVSCIGSKLLNARTYINMFRMVGAGRVDYLITTFPPGTDLSVELYGVKLRPVEGVKVVFKDSLHFAVSRRYPQGKKIFLALQAGLDQLASDGTLHYVSELVGYNNALVSGWDNVGCVDEH